MVSRNLKKKSDAPIDMSATTHQKENKSTPAR